jgi:hypothetical protein
MKVLRSVAMAALLALATAKDPAAADQGAGNGRVRGGGSRRNERYGSWVWGRRALADHGVVDHDIASLPPVTSHVEHETPQPTYPLPVVFYELPPVYHVPPVHPTYHADTPAPTTTYPTSAPLKSYRTPSPVYHVPEHDTFHPVPPRRMTNSPSRHYHEHVAPVAEPTYREHVEPTYSEPKPTYSKPKPTYAEPEPTYAEEPTYDEPTYDEPTYDEPTYDEPTYDEPTYAEPKPTYDEEKPTYDEAKPTYDEPTYSKPKPTYSEPEPTYVEPTYAEEPTYDEPTYAEPKPSYDDEKPTDYEARPTYDEPTYSKPKPTYVEPTYAEEPTYDEPTYAEPTPTYDDEKPTYYEAKPTYDEPTYSKPKPTYSEPKPTYDEPKPKATYYDEKPNYDEAKPTYDEAKPSYDESTPAYDPPRPPTYEKPEPTYVKPKPTYDEPVYDDPAIESYEEPVKPDDYGKYDKDEVCHIKVFVDCKDGYGGPCQEVHIPMENECARGEPLESLTFKYENGKCNPSANSQGREASCVDKGIFSFWDPVDVFCRKASTTLDLVVEPRTVLPGGTFTISNPGSYLPEKIDCIFRDQKGLLVQNNVINTSGKVDLNLMDSFGAMTVYSCASLDCIETLHYEVNIENLGDIALNIETVDFLLNEDKYHLLSDMAKRSLAPGESTTVEVTAEVDICKVGFSYEAYVYVEAHPQYGKICSDELRYEKKSKWSAPTHPLL